MNRLKKIIKVSIIGIITNIFLVIFKAIIGFISGSISIIMDALNNLSDALSSIITIIGMILSGKKPDKKHPYGYGKIEYLSSLTIAIIILATGASSLIESIKKIKNPTIATFTPIMLIIIIVGIITKLLLGKYVKKQGEKLNSDSLIASGSDALFDSIISLSTLISALISYIFKLSIDGYLGVIISIIIIKSAIEIILDSFNNIIGTRIENNLSLKIKQSINKYKEVLGTYDLILHEYGPEKMIGSIHIEIKDDLNAKDIHSLTRKITEEIYEDFGVILTVGIYATNTYNDEYAKIKKNIRSILKKYPTIIQFHGYYVDSDTSQISFDLIFDFKEKESLKIKNEIINKLNKLYPNYDFNIIIDNDFSD